MQRLARKSQYRILFGLRPETQTALLGFFINLIPNQAAPQAGHMNADLMRPSGLQITLNQRCRLPKNLCGLIIGNRSFAAGLENRHFFPIIRAAPDIGFNPPAKGAGTP